MAEIVPRWEWRTFARDVPRADAAFDAMTPDSVEESDELYLLAPGGDNVKVRDGLMDIKVLRETDAAGLQRWEPILKAPFPLDAEAARTVFQGLRRPLPAIPPDGLTSRRTPGSGGGRCDRRSARGPGPQAACPLHRRRLPGRAVRHRGRRASNDVDRSRVDGPGGRRGRGRRARPARLPQSGRPDGAAAARRSGAGALRGHRRRHELDQVPHRRARRGRAWPVADRRRSGGRDPARRGPRGDRRDRRRAARADRAGDQRDGGRGPQRSTSGPSRWSVRREPGWLATGPRSSRRFGLARGCRSRSSRGRTRAGSPISPS